MMNKKAKLFILGACSFGLSSCTLPIRPVNAINQDTASYNLPAEYNMGNVTYQSSSLPAGYEPVDKTLSDLKNGFVLIKDIGNGHIGAFSPLLDTIIVPADYASIDLLSSEDNGVYLKAHKNGLFDVYDFLGHKVVSEIADSSSFSIRATKFTLPCQIVTLVEEYRVNDVVTLRSIESDRTRKAFSYPSYMFPKDGQSFLASSFDLATIGLAGYSGALDSKGSFVVTHGEDTCSTINVADSPDIRLCFWKAFFTQSNEVVTDGDYDYAMDISGEETHFKISTQQIALVNGEAKDLSVPYLIEDIRPVYNENKQAHYALVYAFPIVDKQLASDLSIYVINNDGEITYDATADAAYQYGTSFITHFKMYDYMTGSLIDFDFKVVGTLSDPVVDHNSTWEFLKTDKNGTLGLYDYGGNPFVTSGYSYLSIDTAPEQTVFGVTSEGQPVSYQPLSNTVTPISLSSSQLITDRGFGALRIDTMVSNQVSSASYITYSQTALSSFNSPLLVTSSLKTYLARSFTDSFFDSLTNSYSFFSGICQY